MPLDLGTLTRVDPNTKDALDRAVRYINQLEGALTALQDQVNQQGPILTMAQIQKGLSATGSNPLSLQGLTGTPTT